VTELLVEPIRNAASTALFRVANRLLAGLAESSSTSMVLRKETDESWFLAEIWQAGEREVDAFVARGEVSVFDDVEGFLASLSDVTQAE
jgi:hypothetical protein